jgi:hypothetical protein
MQKQERNMQNNTTLIKAATAAADDGIQLYINLAQHGLQVNGRKVNSISMFVSTEAEDYGDGDTWYCDGDLAVNWEAEDDSSYVHNSSMIMRNTSDSNNNTVTMGEFYWESAFTATLHELLQQHGFSKEDAESVCTSEWGMQDVGRASYDANSIGDAVRAAHNIAVAA